MTKRLDILVNLIKQGNGDKQVKAGLEGIQLSTKEAEISVKALDRRYSQLITEVSKGNKTVSQAQNEYRDFARQLGVTERATQDAGFSFTELNQALELGQKAFDGVQTAADLVIDTMERGTRARALQNTFESLATPLGSTVELMDQLRSSTNNAVNDTLLLEGANKALNLRLAGTSGELVQLVSNAAALGANLGDVGGTVDDVLAAIANESKLRLDNFGVAASRVEELQLELQAAGEEGTFAQAVMIALEETVQRTGARANLAASDVDILKTAIENAKDEAALAATEGFGPLIQTLNDIGAIEGFGDFVADIGSAVGAMSVQVAILSNDAVPLRERFQAIADVNEQIRDEMGGWTVDYQRELVLFRAKYDELTDSAEGFAEVTGELADGQIGPLTREQALAMQELGENTEAAAEATEDANKAWRESVRQQQLLASRQQGLNRATQDGVGFVGDIRQGWVEYNDTIEESVEQTNDYRDSINEMAAAANSARQAEQDRIASLGDYATSIQLAADGTFSANDAIFAHIDALDASPEVTIAAGLALGVYTEAQARARIEGFLLEQELRRVEQAVADGRLTNDQGVDAFVGLATGVYDTATAAILANDAFLQNSSAIDDMEASALDVIPSLQSVEDKLLAVSGDAQAFADALNSIPTNIAVDILVRQSGQFTPPPSSTGPGPRHDGGPVAAGQPYLVGDGPGGSYIPGATELFIPSQSGHVVSNRQVEQAIASMSNSNNRSFTDRSSVTFNLRGSRSNLREARRQRHRRTARSMGKLING